MTFRISGDQPDNYICIVGLGYVGLTLAISMADVGFKILGIEKNLDIFAGLTVGKPHFYEPKLEQSLCRHLNSSQLTIHSSLPKEGARPTAYIITVGTPLNELGQVRLDMVEEASRQVANHCEDGALVILRSTLRLGTTRNIVQPILEQSGKNIELAFCPERTVEGQALSELRYLPQIVGGLTLSSSLRASSIFQYITSTVVKVSEPETAEMIKMIDNTYRDIVFGFSNEIARACDASGVSAVEVIRSAKLGYPRTNLYMPGPVGGPCLSKDPHILSEGLKSFDVKMDIAMSARTVNEAQPAEVVNMLEKLTSTIKKFPDNPNITLLGLAFKGRPATNDLRGSMAKPVLSELFNKYPNASFYGYDPMVDSNEISSLGLIASADLQTAFKDSNLVIILNNHSEFENMPVREYSFLMTSPGLIYDFWNNFIPSDLVLQDGIGYIGLGNLCQGIIPG